MVMTLETDSRNRGSNAKRYLRIICEGLTLLARQLVFTAGLVVLSALVIFAFDLDALIRFLFRFSEQYVGSDRVAQNGARHMIVIAYVALNIVFLTLKSLNLIFGPKRKEGEPS